MTQPSSKRLVTEDVHDATQSAQDARLAQLETAAGFPNPPMAVEDAAVSALVNDDSSNSRVALDTFYSPVIPGRITVTTLPGDATAQLQARLDDLDANGGGTLEIPDTGGEHTISATLRHGANTRIVGQSKGTRLGLIGNLPLIAAKSPEVRQDNVEISNLELRRYGSVASTPIVDWTGVSHSNMRDVKIEQGSGRDTSIGVLLGLNSYYNEFTSVQGRELNEAFKMVDAANGNRFNGSTVALYCNHGYVVDNSNSNVFEGASVELCDGVGFDVRNGSKQNQLMAPRIENVPLGIRVAYSANPAFGNFIIAPSFYMGLGHVAMDIQTDNVVLEGSKGLPLRNLKDITQRSYVSAYKNTAQATLPVGTWTKVTFQAEDADYLAEFNSSTFTAKSSGLFDVNASVQFPTTSEGNIIEVALYKNGALLLTLDKRTSIGSEPTRVGGARTIDLGIGDTVEVFVFATKSVAILSGRSNASMQLVQRG